ncbi:hypothetical protein GCM10009743_64560 [Kribbella swartbergensis]
MRNKPTHHIVRTDYISQVPTTIQRMKACRPHRWRVPNVMQPGSYLNNLRLLTEHPRQLPRPLSHPLSVRPPPRQRTPQQLPSERPGLLDTHHTPDSTTDAIDN